MLSSETSYNSLFSLDLGEQDWTAGADGYVYYNNTIEPNGNIKLQLDIHITELLSNQYQNIEFNLEFVIESIQYSNIAYQFIEEY